MSMSEGEHAVCVLPAVLARKPSRALWEEKHEEHQEDSRKHLHTPRNPERGSLPTSRSVLPDERSSVGDVVQDQDTPGDSPLLKADQSTAKIGRHNFRDVDRHLRRLNANREAVDDSAGDEHADVLRSTNNHRADDPEDTAEHDGFLATKNVGDVAGSDSAKPGTSRHSCRDATLGRRSRTTARAIRDASLIEVAEVRLSTDDSTHRLQVALVRLEVDCACFAIRDTYRDIEAEKATANDGDAGNHVDLKIISA